MSIYFRSVFPENLEPCVIWGHYWNLSLNAKSSLHIRPRWGVWFVLVNSSSNVLSSYKDSLRKKNENKMLLSSAQFTQLCPTLCNSMNRSMPGLPVHHQLPKFTQTQVHWVSDAIQPSHPLSPLSPPAFNLSQHQRLFKWVSSSHQVAKVLEFQLQHQSL